MRKLINYFSVGAVILLASCEKSPEYQPAGFGPASAVTGVVIATDEFQNPLPVDQQPSIEVSIAPQSGEGTNATTTAQGNSEFSLNNVNGGTYNLTYRASGYREVVRPGVLHAGSNPTKVDTTFLIQQSTTTVTELTAAPRVDVARIRFIADYPMTANTNYFFAAGDTIFFLNTQITPNLNVTVVPKQDTTLNYPKDTLIYDPRIIETFTTYLVANLKLGQTSTDSAIRGAMLVISDDPNPTAENYRMIQTRLQTKPLANPAFSDTLSFVIPLTSLESAGIIHGGNRRVYIAAYGLSGRLFAYGATLSADRRFYVYPSRNEQRSDVAQTDF